MNTRISTAILGAATLFVLGCSTPPAPQLSHLPPPAPEFKQDLPLESPDMVIGKVCKLGDSCLALDSRPFEACLVGTKHCVDKAREPILVGTPKPPGDSGAVETRVERAE